MDDRLKYRHIDMAGYLLVGVTSLNCVRINLNWFVLDFEPFKSILIIL